MSRPNPPKITRQPIGRTWETTLPLLMTCVQHGTDKARDQALSELRQMARLADRYNAEHPEEIDQAA